MYILVLRLILLSATLGLVGCSSSSTAAINVRDARISSNLAASPASPGTAAGVTLSFSLQNTDREVAMTGVPYQVVRTNLAGQTTILRTTTLNLAAGEEVPIELSEPSPVSGYIDGIHTGSGIFTYTVTVSPVEGEVDLTNNSSSLKLAFADLELVFSTEPQVSMTSGQPVILATLTCTDRNPGDAVSPIARAVFLSVRDPEGSTVTPDSIVASSPAGTYPVDIAAGSTQTYTITLPNTVSAGEHVFLTIDPDAEIPEASRENNEVELVIPEA